MNKKQAPTRPKLVADEGYILSSSAGNKGCVAVKITGDGVKIRDTKHPGGPVLEFTQKEWRDFISGVKKGEFDA